MIIHPIYIVSGLSGLLVFFLLISRSTKQQTRDQFIDMDERKHFKEEPTPTNTDHLPELVTMYLIPKSPISGNDLLHFLLSHNLQYNNNQIFYCPGHTSGRFQVATLTPPGTFNLETIANESFPGLSFFIQPKSSPSPLEDFDALCQIIFDAKDRFDAVLQSTQKEEISLDSLRQLRDVIAHEEV